MSFTPILYSFRRCPFAIRARMALLAARVRVEVREVKLSDMPEQMLSLSAKATVPVLQIGPAEVIDESLDIMIWGLKQSDPDKWLEIPDDAKHLISVSDVEFKPLLDKYKYADRHPDISPLLHRQNAQVFIQALEHRLQQNHFLGGKHFKLVDGAILPFIRQFAGVDPKWFESCAYASLREWLNSTLNSEPFHKVMQKQPIWRQGNQINFNY